MISFVNILENNDQKQQWNGTIKDGTYRGKLLLPMKDFVPFGTNHQVILLM